MTARSGESSGPRAADATGVRVVREFGYDGCVEITNGRTRVLLEPNLGGRVLSYALDGHEALWRDPGQPGVVWDGRTRVRHPCAGRFDLGPEYGGLPHDELWLGRWTAEIIGPRSARMSSQTLAAGLQLERLFVLDADSSHLRCTQIMRNRGTAPLRVFHWGRTFAPAGGIALAPLPAAGRFPRGYALGGPAGTIDFQPAPEPNVRIRDGILEILGPPAKAKFILDVNPGWLAYLSPAGLLFLKGFAVYPDRPYGEIAANNASIWYSSEQNAPAWTGRGHVVEIEPIGPLEVLGPGGECAFTEHWWLEPFAFPADRNVNLARLRDVVARMTAECGRPTEALR